VLRRVDSLGKGASAGEESVAWRAASGWSVLQFFNSYPTVLLLAVSISDTTPSQRRLVPIQVQLLHLPHFRLAEMTRMEEEAKKEEEKKTETLTL
jgi:hypothetical protein